MARRKKTSAKTVLKAMLATAMLAYLLSVVEGAALADALRTANARWIGAALALLPINLWLEARGWRLLARHAGADVSTRTALRSVLAGHTLGLATPARLGELAGRAFALPAGRRGVLAALVYAHRLAAMAVGVGVGWVAFWIFVVTRAPSPSAPWLLAAAYGAVVFALLLAALLSPHRLHHRLSRSPWLRRQASSFDFLKTLRPRTMGRLLCLEACRYALYTSQFVLLVLAFAPGSLAVVVLGAALVFYAKLLLPPVALFDLGIREGAAVFFFGLLGVLQAAAFSAALLLFCVNLLLPALLGTPYLLLLKREGEVATASSVPA